MPEFTKPMTITLVAAEDWITRVTAVPRRIPFRGVLDSRYSTTSSLFPANCLSPSLMSPIPNRNSATPPSRAMIFAIDKKHSSSFPSSGAVPRR